MLFKRIIPDINFGGSTADAPTVAITLTPHNYPGASYEIVAPKSVVETSSNVYTEQVFIRVRARQMGFKIESDALNTQWQLGTPRLDARADGKRYLWGLKSLPLQHSHLLQRRIAVSMQTNLCGCLTCTLSSLIPVLE